MDLKKIEGQLTVCKLKSTADIDLNHDFYFIGRTDEEISLVCKTEDTPAETLVRDDGWRAFRIQGTLDFSMIGVLSKISSILAANKIGIFAVSTYNTDYILVKEDDFDASLMALQENGYTVEPDL
ncbi:MAG: ACT domain-containing protein [Selenomonas sp.]|nr:ACT domain-containing protein [Selenomonas sp.]MBR6268569.1 ACT domain-containing protein [Selenomonadaceae bacterium]